MAAWNFEAADEVYPAWHMQGFAFCKAKDFSKVMASLPAYIFFLTVIHSTTSQQNIFALFFFFFQSRWKAEGVLWGEGRSIWLLALEASHDFCLLGAAMSYPTCHQSWRLQHSPGSAPEERRPHIWVCGTEKLKNPLGRKNKKERKKGRGRNVHNRHYLWAGSEFPLLLLWKSSPQKVKNIFLYLSHSLNRKICPWPSFIYPGHAIEGGFNPNTVLKIGWMIKMLT